MCVCVCACAHVFNLEYSIDLKNYIQENNFLWNDMVFGGYWAVRTASFRTSWLGQCNFHESGFLIEEWGWPFLSFMFASSWPSDSCHGWLGNKTFNRCWDLELWPWPSSPAFRLSEIMLNANDLPYRILSWWPKMDEASISLLWIWAIIRLAPLRMEFPDFCSVRSAESLA